MCAQVQLAMLPRRPRQARVARTGWPVAPLAGDTLAAVAATPCRADGAALFPCEIFPGLRAQVQLAMLPRGPRQARVARTGWPMAPLAGVTLAAVAATPCRADGAALFPCEIFPAVHAQVQLAMLPRRPRQARVARTGWPVAPLAGVTLAAVAATPCRADGAALFPA
ncbi:hypothetical protein JAB4_059580 (plasmid) [Janthinobacterium sp. HH102]|nr:hypothetical protein JAB4_059570 [Janthinobacterium sp. HH102]QOU76458.1 hypothetical protein JAB4_059580 [Janthinobacterium sp. HH102]